MFLFQKVHISYVLKEYEARFPDRIHFEGSGAVPDSYAVPAETSAEEKKDAPADETKTKSFFRFRVPVRKRSESAQQPQLLADQLAALNENQLKIVGVMDRPSMHVDDIIDLTRLPASVVLSELTMLQIKGFVSQEQGKRFTLNVSK